MRLIRGKEFAAERGVHQSRVSQWRRQKRLVLSEDGRLIDADASHAQLNAQLDQSKGTRSNGNFTANSIVVGVAGAVPPQPGDTPAPEQPAGDLADRLAGQKEDSGYWIHKARREKAEAELSELKALQAVGAVVPAAGVKKVAAEIGRKFRDALLAQPDDLAQVLDPANPGRAHRLLKNYNENILRELRIELEQRAAAAAGADEREPALL